MKKVCSTINSLPARFNQQRVSLKIHPNYISKKDIKGISFLCERLPMNFVFLKLQFDRCWNQDFELHDIYLALTRCKQFYVYCDRIRYNVAPQIEMKDIEADSVEIIAAEVNHPDIV